MQSINQCLTQLKQEGKKSFVPYITAGDPSLEGTKKIVWSLSNAGASVIELGIPFSDPIADGPTNQRAAERALKQDVTLQNVIDLVKELRSEGCQTPILLFSYFNPIYRMGLESFMQRAQEAGVQGALIVDLPPEGAVTYRELMASYQLETIFLASPTTAKSRLKLINEASTGFVYYVSRTGITGAKTDISSTLEEELSLIKKEITQPIAVGFGISNPQQAQSVARLADGVVIGSAIVQLIEKSQSIDEAVQKVGHFTEEIISAIQEASKC